MIRKAFHLASAVTRVIQSFNVEIRGIFADFRRVFLISDHPTFNKFPKFVAGCSARIEPLLRRVYDNCFKLFWK